MRWRAGEFERQLHDDCDDDEGDDDDDDNFVLTHPSPSAVVYPSPTAVWTLAGALRGSFAPCSNSNTVVILDTDLLPSRSPAASSLKSILLHFCHWHFTGGEDSGILLLNSCQIMKSK